MSSASIYASGKVYKNGNIGVFLRLIHNRKAYLKQIVQVEPDQFNMKALRMRGRSGSSVQINALIEKELAEANEYLVSCRLKRIDPDPERFFSKITGDELLSKHIAARADGLAGDKGDRHAANYMVVSRKVIAYNIDVPVMSLTKEWVKNFDKRMREDGLKPSTRGKYMTIIASTIKAIDDAPYPFKDFRRPAGGTIRVKLAKTEIDRLASVGLSGMEAVARDVFLFAMYARGMRVFDTLALTWSSIDGDRLRYVANKTGKVQDIQVGPEIRAILDRYSGGEYIFPVMRIAPSIRTANIARYLKAGDRAGAVVNKHLKSACIKAGIKKHVTMHVARHTFAYLADQAGVPLGNIQQLLDHERISTTDNYVRSIKNVEELDGIVKGMF